MMIFVFLLGVVVGAAAVSIWALMAAAAKERDQRGD